MSIYNFETTLEDGTVYSLKKYAGKPIIIVNTATKCGLAPQFKQLEELYQAYQTQGLVILGFPSNQFKQEKVVDSDMESICQLNFGVSFPLNETVEVNGPKTEPIFQWLKQETQGLFSNNIKWNFTKFLIDREGRVVKRYSPTTSPKAIEKDILKLL